MIKTKIKQLILLAGDFGAMFVALFVAIIIRYGGYRPEMFLPNFYLFIPIFIGWILAYYISGYYDLKNTPYGNLFFQGLVKTQLLLLVLAIAYFYLFPSRDLSPKTNLVLFVVIFLVVFIFWRRLFFSFLRGTSYKSHLAFIGYNPRVEEIIQDVKNNPQLGYSVKLVLSAEKLAIPGIECLTSHERLEELVAKHKIDIIVMERGTKDDEELRKRLFNCLPLGVSYITLSNFYEKITGKIPLEIIGQAWFLENLNLEEKKIYESAKRIMDLGLAFVVLAISLPFWPIIMLVIKLESKGPAFFWQMRLGKNNVPFRIIKFRTMKVENNQQEMTKKNDQRITKWGKFLRQSRIDEIPQVFNIIRGEMSFVGPRPERPEIAGGLEGEVPFFGVRTLVKPGVSGWDQISGEYHSPSMEDTFKKLQYDLFYLKNRSIYLDITVMLKTLRTILIRSGR